MSAKRAAPKKVTKAKSAPKAAKEAKADRKLSQIDAAAKVLKESGEPMNCPDLVKAMAEKGYWKTTGGKTPHATLYSSILRHIKLHGADAQFVKTERGKFTLAK